MKTSPSRLVLSHCTTASVKVSQPLSLWEFAWCALTVSTALSNNTPEEYIMVLKKRKKRQQLCSSCKGNLLSKTFLFEVFFIVVF